jgi:hypothetical protein
LKIPNGLVKISAKTPSEVRGEGGRDSDIDIKKMQQIVIFRGEKLQKETNLFAWKLAFAYT